jgi:hypothetical protein
VHHRRTPGALVQIIDVLGNDGYFKDIFKILKGVVGLVRLRFSYTHAAFIVETQNGRGPS